MKKSTGILTILLAFALCSIGAFGVSALELDMDSTSVAWIPDAAYGKVQVTLSGPTGVLVYDFDGSDVPYIESFDLTDGSYTWELKAYPALDDATRAALSKARATGDKAFARQIPSTVVQTGYFTVEGGAFQVTAEEVAEKASDLELPDKDQVIIDDLIVDGSACIGDDCANGENFGFDTLRLKENNLRIKFQDTSNSGSFPSNDWQLTANDSSNGGANKFSIDDIDGGRTPFTVEASAPSNSLYVDDGGRVGLGTATPVVELHVVDGDSPTLRLEQDGSSGFTPQTWDLAGNEANFFVRDVTNGSRLPFKIVPSAPTNSLYIAADGDIGLGTASPDAGLHIIKSGVKIANTDDGIAPPEMLEIQNSVDNMARIRFDDGSGQQWNIGGGSGDTFAIFDPSNGISEFILTDTGNLTITGALTQNSDVNAKANFKAVDAQQVLSKVAELPVTTWNYLESPDFIHMGPMAQDFYAAFGLGINERGIAPLNLASVALVSIQGLNEAVQEKDTEISQLKEENAALATRLANLEALVSSLVEGN